MKGLIRKLLLSAVVTTAALVLLNGLLFLGECAAYGTWWSNGQPVGLYINTPGERPQLKPGARLRGLLYSISINSMGFRGPELASVKPENGLRIWCVGGSTTFDIFAPDDERTWPALLQQRLQQALPHRTVEVVNAGIPGEIFAGSAEDLQRKGADLGVDIVVVYHGPNDMRGAFDKPEEGMVSINQGAEMLQEDGPPDGGILVGPPDAGDPLGGSLNRDIAFFRVLGRVIQSSKYVQVSRTEIELTPKRINPVRRELMSFLRTVEGIGARPVLVTHALRADPADTGAAAERNVAEMMLMFQMSGEEVIEAFELYNQLIAQTAKSRRMPLADVRSVVPPEPELWGDAIHFREGGSVLAAEEIAQAILASELVQ